MWFHLQRQHSINIQENNRWSVLQCPTYSQEQTRIRLITVHYKQHFNYTFILVKRLNTIGTMESFTELNWILIYGGIFTGTKTLHKKRHAPETIWGFVGPVSTKQLFIDFYYVLMIPFLVRAFDNKMDIKILDLKTSTAILTTQYIFSDIRNDLKSNQAQKL